MRCTIGCARLVDLLDDVLEPWHFGDSLGTERLAFDHRLRKGPATTRNAIALLRFSGVPDALVSRAASTADLSIVSAARP